MYIPFQGQLTQHDLTDIFTLAFKSQRWLTYIFGPLFVILTAALTISMIYDAFNLFWIVAVVFTGFMASYPFWGPSTSARSAYQNQPEMRGTFVGAINDDGVLLRTIHVTQNIQWTLYTKLIRDKHTVLLYQNPRCFNFFPRSFFSAEGDWLEFQALLDSKVAKGELQEQTRKPDFRLGTNFSRRKSLLTIGGLALPVLCFIIALIVTLIYQAGQ